MPFNFVWGYLLKIHFSQFGIGNWEMQTASRINPKDCVWLENVCATLRFAVGVISIFFGVIILMNAKWVLRRTLLWDARAMPNCNFDSVARILSRLIAAMTCCLRMPSIELSFSILRAKWCLSIRQPASNSRTNANQSTMAMCNYQQTPSENVIKELVIKRCHQLCSNTIRTRWNAHTLLLSKLLAQIAQ